MLVLPETGYSAFTLIQDLNSLRLEDYGNDIVELHKQVRMIDNIPTRPIASKYVRSATSTKLRTTMGENILRIPRVRVKQDQSDPGNYLHGENKHQHNKLHNYVSKSNKNTK